SDKKCCCADKCKCESKCECGKQSVEQNANTCTGYGKGCCAGPCSGLQQLVGPPATMFPPCQMMTPFSGCPLPSPVMPVGPTVPCFPPMAAPTFPSMPPLSGALPMGGMAPFLAPPPCWGPCPVPSMPVALPVPCFDPCIRFVPTMPREECVKACVRSGKVCLE